MIYHLSAADIGPMATLRPRIPRDRAVFENRTVSRVCVAPTIAGCLLALRGCWYNRGRWVVYTTDAETVEPIGVPDAQETGELWVVRPAEFRRCGIIIG